VSAARRVAPRLEAADPIDGAAANDDALAAGLPEREVMSVEETAVFLGVDRKTVYDFAGRGMIPCRRLGKRILFSRQALVVWLRGECCKGLSDGESR